MSNKKLARKGLEAGDVLKTNPAAGYWGCALVLTAGGTIGDLGPMCHIGITAMVLRHDYAFAELVTSALTVLEFERSIRVGPNEYRPLRRETCIGIYASRVNPHVDIIGHIDVSDIHPEPLTWEVGDGLSGGWPLCGPVRASLGSEAVVAWRQLHDSEQWEEDQAASQRSTEEMLAKLAFEARAKRKSKKGGP